MMKSNTINLNRRQFMKFATVAGAASFMGTFCQSSTIDRKLSRPNILFCLADDWGWPHAGACGDNVVKTPVFDRIAEEGVLFENAFVSSPSCTPSRNAILTGQQFYRLKEGASLRSTLDVNLPNFMFLLRDHGYEIGRWRKGWGPGDFSKGGYTEYPCGPESSFEDFMTHRDKNKPFCFWFGTSDPHRPYEKGSGQKSGIHINHVHVPEFYPDHEKIRSDIADYYYEVQRWDKDVGKAIRLLEKSGALDNTIVVMTGDHGMPFPRCKANLYDYGTRVPLAFRWGDRIKSGRKVADFASFTDFAPTFLEAAGVEVPEQMTGKSLLPILESESSDKERDFIVFGRERHTPAQKMPSMEGYPARALRTDKWLLILNLEPERWPAGVPTGATHPMNSHSDCDNSPTKSFLIDHKNDPELSRYYQLCFAKRPPVELYDCDTDKDQVNNLAAKPEFAPVLKKLKQKLESYLKSTSDPRFVESQANFDTYPYYADYLKEYLQKHGYEGLD
ncbi:MAG: sulfatase-like hydrolase/transferase [candidate division KSB1 bacterium]|nr:sulfatase-like hydrolase/transferase [candidate division KSB1 bacterium]